MSRVLALLFLLSTILRAADDIPRVVDPNLTVELFAKSPDIVHPIGLDFDAKGRLLVIESHTHFPPGDYKGPKHDRIRLIEDTNGDGKADRFGTFYEGTKRTMDIAVHPDGWVYLATRNEILRVRDKDGDGKAEISERVLFLETKGDYPHNGLSGLCFDAHGDLYFGLGENLGAEYKLIASDGTTHKDQGEGGNIFWCTADGKKLRRVATGFWNPFGTCRDIRGRLFTVDNDPDAMPPCRMMHVVEGGDYGYQFRYGRSGRHPFQCWDGQLPGTLPMMAGVGEAPCEILSYESDGLPNSYRGDLLVTSWADHRVERYVVKERGASFSGERKPFVQGGKDFRPVGLAVAPDGSLFVSDWVLSNYQLHGKGAIWHIKPKKAVKPERPTEPEKALFSMHRPLRDAAARQLGTTEKGRVFLRNQLKHDNVRVRAAALTALIDIADNQTDVKAVAMKESDPGLRALAVSSLATRDVIAKATPDLLKLAIDADPFIRHEAIRQLARNSKELSRLYRMPFTDPRHRVALLLADRASGQTDAVKRVPGYLALEEEEVRFFALKWIADEKLSEYRDLVVKGMENRKLSVRLYMAYATALARLDGKEVSESKLADVFVDRLADAATPTDLRLRLLQLIPAKHPKLKFETLTELLKREEVALQRETVQVLAEHASPKRGEVLLSVLRDEKRDEGVRAQALVSLADQAQDRLDDLFPFTQSKNKTIREEALRALVGVKLKNEHTATLQDKSDATDLVNRLLGKPFSKDRQPTKETEVWLKRLEGPADIEAGRRVFFHPRLANCARCHRVDGRGQDVGPDLSSIGKRERRFILESILQPSNNIAPHFQVWAITTSDGKTRNGLLHRTNLDEYTYIDEKGKPFKVITRDMEESRALTTSIMPDGLVNLLTDQEIRDLLAFLGSRR